MRRAAGRVPEVRRTQMAPVPTEAEIDAMSEEKLEAYLAQAH